MSFYVSTHSRISQSKNRILSVKMPFYVGKISLTFILTFFIGILGVVYMINFNGNATVGYQLTKLESERDKLQNTQEQQNINLSRSQSLEYIRNSQSVAQMVPVNEVQYFDGESVVAYTTQRTK